MATIELTLYVEDPLQEFLIAKLLDLDFEAFEQDDLWVKACIPAARFDDLKRETIERWLAARGLDAPVEERVVEDQNWNAQWEETIQPQVVGPFLIKPTWAAVPVEQTDRILLEIDPKMSFGTGYHASTRLVLTVLPDVIRGGESVLDAGTGTGILAIAALKLGAAYAVAFDIDLWAQQNAVENFHLNGVAEQVDFRAGSIDTVPEAGFDLILANINRNTLLELLPAFAEKVQPDGSIVLSGLLRTDRDRVRQAVEDQGFRLVREAEEGAWWCLVLIEG